jgi:hypothetical protein
MNKWAWAHEHDQRDNLNWMHNIANIWKHVCFLKLYSEIMHLIQTSQTLVVIGPSSFCWRVENIYICQNGSKCQNNYICFNSHNIMYMILIIIYCFDMKFLLIVCLNSHYGYVQDYSSLAIILFYFCINKIFLLWFHTLNKYSSSHVYCAMTQCKE